MNKQKTISIIFMLFITFGTPYVLYHLAETLPMKEYTWVHWVFTGWFLLLLVIGLWKFFYKEHLQIIFKGQNDGSKS